MGLPPREPVRRVRLGFPCDRAAAGSFTPEARVDRDSEARVDQDGEARAGEDGSTRAGEDGSTRAGRDGGTPILEFLARLSEGTLPGRMGVIVTAASAERVTGTMPVDGNIQPYGLLHGGASCVLAESLGSVGAALQAGPGGLRSVSRSAPRTTARWRPASSRGWPPGCTAGGPAPPTRSRSAMTGGAGSAPPG